MRWTKRVVLSWMLVVLTAAGLSRAPAAEMPVEEAWEALPRYQYGQDMAPLLALDRAMIDAMAAPPRRAAWAARLAALLQSPETTLAARQYICLQLRQVGTAAEVPVLARLLADEETSEMARQALEAISGEESLAVLRDALGTLKGKLLVGVINSLAARRDARSVAALQSLADAEDPQVASAALGALGQIGGRESAAFLIDRAEKAGMPTPPALAVPLLQCAYTMADDEPELARAVYTKLSQAGQPGGVRRAAMLGRLDLQDEDQGATILAWLADKDPDRRRVAASRLSTLSDGQLEDAAGRLDGLPEASQHALIEVLAARRGQEALPLLLSLVRSDNPKLKLAAVRCLGQIGDRAAIPLLIDTLAAGGELTGAAQQALGSLPREDVGKALLDALTNRPALRVPVIEVLASLKYYEAIDPLVALAAEDDPAVYGPALDGLRRIADPDQHDIPRLLRLLFRTPPGKHRDEVEKTILIVCEKLPAGADRAGPVVEALAKMEPATRWQYLPLLGRLGGPKALERIESALKNPDPEIQEAAVRALCNWPNAEVVDRLLDIATHSDQAAFRRWALRAYVRVVSLKSDRPAQKTLAMLQSAMKFAENVEDKRLILERAAAVRTMETVVWLASYLDDPDLAQAACRAIVELAHHRFLRHPNMDRFAPILEKVGRISQDPQVVERAKRYRLGL